MQTIKYSDRRWGRGFVRAGSPREYRIWFDVDWCWWQFGIQVASRRYGDSVRAWYLSIHFGPWGLGWSIWPARD